MVREGWEGLGGLVDHGVGLGGLVDHVVGLGGLVDHGVGLGGLVDRGVGIGGLVDHEGLASYVGWVDHVEAYHRHTDPGLLGPRDQAHHLLLYPVVSPAVGESVPQGISPVMGWLGLC